MIFKSLILLMILISTSALGCLEVPSQLKPETSIVTIDLCRTDYQVAYSISKKSPIWVGEHLTDKEVNEEKTRINAFKADPQLVHGQRAELSDYANSGFDRGHMAPAGDASSPKAISESFYLSNMVPQTLENNRGIWKALEEKVRAMILNRKDLYIFTGPIYSANPKTIGKDNILVPYALYKIIYDDKTKESISFIIPNEAEEVSKLTTFIVTISQVREKTGITFLKDVTVNEIFHF